MAEESKKEIECKKEIEDFWSGYKDLTKIDEHEIIEKGLNEKIKNLVSCVIKKKRD